MNWTELNWIEIFRLILTPTNAHWFPSDAVKKSVRITSHVTVCVLSVNTQDAKCSHGMPLIGPLASWGINHMWQRRSDSCRLLQQAELCRRASRSCTRQMSLTLLRFTNDKSAAGKEPVSGWSWLHIDVDGRVVIGSTYKKWLAWLSGQLTEEYYSAFFSFPVSCTVFVLVSLKPDATQKNKHTSNNEVMAY